MEDKYICKDCGNPIEDNYVTVHWDCQDIHPKDRKKSEDGD